MWTFVELHGEFYVSMAEKWNEENPDKKVEVQVNVMPYDDMHNKLQIALNSGEGTPDFVDIEQGKFSNFTQGTPALMDLSEAAEPYMEDIVKSRLDLYSKDGTLYGLPTHVGATVAFYNTELLESADIDYTTIKTWDDFKEAGSKYYEATGKYLGTADTSALWTENILMAQLGADYIDSEGNVAVNSDAMVEAMTLLKELQDANAIQTVPGGNPDKEEAYGAFNQGDYACAIMPMWQMSRYTNYMPDLKGKIAIAPVPAPTDAKAQSVGGGGTGTAVVAGKDHAELAAEFLAYAKLSYEGNVEIWDMLGFDPCNMKVWEDEAVTHNENNQFVQYFANNPFEILLEIKDGISGLESHSSEVYPSINNLFTTVTLNEIFENDTP
ncbi:MAG TPA: carbohydrate ABC transporter substrate-binding protein, partial [Candidatus Merdenecus merdavium]|nr:carbohydrate ABC transporter substrate-binding protein [Candidatus Merdenecus merdavium]